VTLAPHSFLGVQLSSGCRTRRFIRRKSRAARTFLSVIPRSLHFSSVRWSFFIQGLLLHIDLLRPRNDFKDHNMLSSIGFALAVVASMAHAEVILVRILLAVFYTIITDSCVAAECRRSASECQRARDAAPCGPRQQGRHNQLHVSAQRARPVSLPDHLACYALFACLPCSARASLVTPLNPSTYSATGPAPSIPLLHLAISSLHLRLSTHSFF